MKIKRETHHDGSKHLVRFAVTAIAAHRSAGGGH